MTWKGVANLYYQSFTICRVWRNLWKWLHLGNSSWAWNFVFFKLRLDFPGSLKPYKWTWMKVRPFDSFFGHNLGCRSIYSSFTQLIWQLSKRKIYNTRSWPLFKAEIEEMWKITSKFPQLKAKIRDRYNKFTKIFNEQTQKK